MLTPTESVSCHFDFEQATKTESFGHVIRVSSSSDFEKEMRFFPGSDSKRVSPARTPSPRPRSPSIWSRGRASPLPVQRLSPYGKVEIFMRCDELPKMDTFSSSDPICVLYVRRYGQWVEYGRTECIPNCQRPKFAETLILDANNQDHNQLKFSVFDTENLTSKDLHKHQLIGSIEINLLDLLKEGEQNNDKEHSEHEYYLKFEDQAKKRGKLYIVAEEVDQEAVNTNIKMCLSALKLSRKGLNIFGKCDAYFEVERKLAVDSYHPVYRSEVIFRNSEPSIGEVKTLSLKKNQFSRSAVADSTSKRGRSDSLSKAAIRILQCVPEEKFSLVDYVKGGCTINFAAAIDFSESNGDGEYSLHGLESSVYEEALSEIGGVLCYYDQRNHYELFGFAGILNGDKESSSCFQMTKQKSNKIFQIGVAAESGLEGLIKLYRAHLPQIKPSGPTILVPLVKNIVGLVDRNVSNDQQHFHLALILTDGICNDMQDTTAALEKYKDYPICFVIACLGPLRMEALHYFTIVDETLRKKCGRSIILPIEFSEENTHHSHQVVRSAFAKLSKSIVQYFISRGIKPRPHDTKQPFSPMDTYSSMLSPDFEDPLTSAANDNWQNFLTEATSFCPTCGSHRSTRPPLSEVNVR
eukprot:gene4319-20525_t